MKKISIILPFFNNEETLEQAIESILGQTFEDFELVLIDNNSTDSSYDIAVKYASKDSRIKLIEEPEQGIVPALNSGILASDSEYIARMDADDLSLPTRLEKQFNYLEEYQDVDAVACQVEHVGYDVNQEGLIEYVRWNNKLLTPEEIEVSRFIESPIIHPTILFRRKLIAEHGLYTDGFFPEDYELWLRWLDKGVKICKINEILYCWTDRPARLTRTDDRYSEQAFYEVKTSYLFNWLKENNRFFPKVVVWGAGRISRKRFAMLQELNVEPKFFIDIHENPKRNVIQYKETPMPGNIFILSYVANRGARDQIREFLIDLGYSEGRDFLCIA